MKTMTKSQGWLGLLMMALACMAGTSQAQTPATGQVPSATGSPAGQDAFGPVGRQAGRTFVGSDPFPRKLYLSDDGRELTIESHRLVKDVLRVTSVPGKYTVMAHSDMDHKYHDEKSFTASLLADGGIAIEWRVVGIADVGSVMTIYRWRDGKFYEEAYMTFPDGSASQRNAKVFQSR